MSDELADVEKKLLSSCVVRSDAHTAANVNEEAQIRKRASASAPRWPPIAGVQVSAGGLGTAYTSLLRSDYTELSALTLVLASLVGLVYGLREVATFFDPLVAWGMDEHPMLLLSATHGFYGASIAVGAYAVTMYARVRGGNKDEMTEEMKEAKEDGMEDGVEGIEDEMEEGDSSMAPQAAAAERARARSSPLCWLVGWLITPRPVFWRHVRRITAGLLSVCLFYLDVSSDVCVCAYLVATGNLAWFTPPRLTQCPLPPTPFSA
jgi:hypothetical protein